MSSIGHPTPTAPVSRRLLAWANERWPLANALFLLFMYLVALMFGQALTSGGELSISAGDLVGFVGVLSYSLLIRVLDEHKDYEVDAENHPDRVLQSGLVTLRHLKVVGAVALVLPLVVSLLEDGGIGRVTMWWAALMVFTLLTFKEFFAADWLRRHRIAYALTHLAGAPLNVLWIAQMGAEGQALPGSILWVALFVTVLAASFELGRKLEAPEDERPTLDSYTKILGTTGSALALAIAAAATTVAGGVALDSVGEGSAAAYAALTLALAPVFLAARRFTNSPTRQNANATEALTGLTVLLQLLVVLVALLAGRGVTF